MNKENNTRVEITLYGGKYTYIREEGKGQRALRYGEEWRDLTGDGFVMAMAQEIEELRGQVATLRGDNASLLAVADAGATGTVDRYRGQSPNTGESRFRGCTLHESPDRTARRPEDTVAPVDCREGGISYGP